MKKYHDIMSDLIFKIPQIESDMEDVVINWASPVPFFGRIDKARIATLGLNPSNKEFECNNGSPLTGNQSRFHTLQSLEIPEWQAISDSQIAQVVEMSLSYFDNNPYDQWFGKLAMMVNPLGCSYHNGGLCHLDLVPFATKSKWAKLSGKNRRKLLQWSQRVVCRMLEASDIQTLIINGGSVARHFRDEYQLKLEAINNDDWSIRYTNGRIINGVSYQGRFSEILGIKLGREIKVLGYNLNIQSTPGVSNEIRQRIGFWIQKNR